MLAALGHGMHTLCSQSIRFFKISENLNFVCPVKNLAGVSYFLFKKKANNAKESSLWPPACHADISLQPWERGAVLGLMVTALAYFIPCPCRELSPHVKRFRLVHSI